MVNHGGRTSCAETEEYFLLDSARSQSKTDSHVTPRDYADAWHDNNARTTSHLPSLKCSKYTWIGHPSMEKRRRSRVEARERNKIWRPPVPLKINVKPTKRRRCEPLGAEYSRHLENFFNHLDEMETNTKLPELSPRAKEAKPDAQLMREKSLVFGHYKQTGQLQQYAMDKAVVPTVYGEIFINENNKDKYVRAMYTYHRKQERSLSSQASECQRSSEFPQDMCQFCDVMGNRYCQYCIEEKNRHFARRYENKLIVMRQR